MTPSLPPFATVDTPGLMTPTQVTALADAGDAAAEAQATAAAAATAASTAQTTADNAASAAIASLTAATTPASTSVSGITSTSAQTFAGAKSVSPIALSSSGGSIAVDLSLSNNFTHTTTEATTLANPTNATAGTSGRIAITQGSTARTLAYGSNWKFAGGTAPSLTASAGAVDVLVFEVISPNFIAAALLKGFA